MPAGDVISRIEEPFVLAQDVEMLICIDTNEVDRMRVLAVERRQRAVVGAVDRQFADVK